MDSTSNDVFTREKAVLEVDDSELGSCSGMTKSGSGVQIEEGRDKRLFFRPKFFVLDLFFDCTSLLDKFIESTLLLFFVLMETLDISQIY